MDLRTQPDKLRQVTTRLRHAYDYGITTWSRRIRCVIWSTPNLPTGTASAGPGYITDRLGELVELGIDYFVLGTVPLAEREILAAEVMPHIRKLGGERR
jgi:hypothetical protein